MVFDAHPVRRHRPGEAVRLLVVCTVSNTVAAFLTPYAEQLRKSGWHVEAAAHGAAGDPAVVAAFDAVHEVQWSRSILDVQGILGSVGRILSILEAGFDIVHVHTPIASFVTRLAVRRMPAHSRPLVVYTAHGFHFHDTGSALTNAVFVTAERIAGRWTDRLIVMNDEDWRNALRARVVPRQRLVRMPGIGVSTKWYSRANVREADVERVRAGLDLDSEAPLFVVVGELSKRKRPTDVVAAFAQMQHAGSRLVFLGDGPERPNVEKLIRNARLMDRVTLRGFVDDVRPVLAAATAVILASSREGLPRAIMEALSMETPVVATAIRGNSELVTPAVGILVPVGDVEALAAALDRLAGDRVAAHEMGIRGRQTMVAKYDLQILISSHEALYDELLARPALDQEPPPGQERHIAQET